jgi:hypothetical protein
MDAQDIGIFLKMSQSVKVSYFNHEGKKSEENIPPKLY